MSRITISEIDNTTNTLDENITDIYYSGTKTQWDAITKDKYYYGDKMEMELKKMNAEDISKDLGNVLPELSGPEVFQVRMKMAVADKYKGQGLEDMEYVFHFGSEYELSGWFSSAFDMPLVKNKDGKYVFHGDNSAPILEKVTRFPFSS